MSRYNVLIVHVGASNTIPDPHRKEFIADIQTVDLNVSKRRYKDHTQLKWTGAK